MNKPQTHLGSYQQAIRLFWKELYITGGKTLYSQQHFGPTKPDWINIEHVFPMAWVVKAFKCRDRRDCRSNSTKFNYVESDMHNLFPSRRDLNMLRGSHRFGSVNSKIDKAVDKALDKALDKAIKGEIRLLGSYDFKIDNKKRMIEPAPASQGEVARAMFHMSATYDLKIFKKQANTLAYWNKVDQPSKEEKRRNDIIEELQGTRNHFIDYPHEIDDLI